jgi:hypothetical protein
MQQCVPNISGVRQLGRALTTQSQLAPRLNEQYSYITTSPLGLRGLLQGELNLYVYDTELPHIQVNKQLIKGNNSYAYMSIFDLEKIIPENELSVTGN